MKTILLFLSLISCVYSTSIRLPTEQFIADGSVTDIVYNNNKLYSATDASCVNIFDVITQKIIKTITLDKITDFMGDSIDSKVYSVDIIQDKVLLLSQAQKGARRLHIHEDNTLKLVLPFSKKLFIAKAKFLDSKTVILGLLSNEIISYDIIKQKINYTVQVSGSKFSDFVLTEDKSKIIIADESGNLKIHTSKDGIFKKELSGQNLDNVFQVDTKNGVIITAGQDRRAVIYKSNSVFYKKSNFLIYSAGLSPSALLAGYASDENNNVTVFNTQTKKLIGVFGNNTMTLTKILFINENEFFVASDSNTINKYKIK